MVQYLKLKAQKMLTFNFKFSGTAPFPGKSLLSLLENGEPALGALVRTTGQFSAFTQAGAVSPSQPV